MHSPFGDVNGVVITRDAVVLGRKRIGTPEQLIADRSELARAARASDPAATIMLAYMPDVPAAAVLAALRALGDSGHAIVELHTVIGDMAGHVCETRAPSPGLPAMSIELDPTWRVIGEPGASFQFFDPPYKDFDGALANRQTRPSDTDRDDVELAAQPDVTAQQLTAVLFDLCKRFPAIRPRAVTELTMRFTGEHVTIGRGPHQVAPTMTLGKPSLSAGQSSLAVAIIRRYIRRNVNKLQYCYEKSLLQNPKLAAGTSTATFTITANGTVGAHTAAGLDPTVDTCVANVIGGIEFPKPTSGEVRVTYPFTFSPR